MPRREYFVIDGNGYVSSTPAHNKGEPEPEAFASFREAEHRAQRHLKYFPLHTVVITQAIAYVTREVAQPRTEIKTRKLQRKRKPNAKPSKTTSPALGTAKASQHTG